MTDDLSRALIDIAPAGMASEVKIKMAEAQHAYRRPEGECKFCDEFRNDSMMPSHTPSKNCESGKHPHCTCSACF
jgi:hypothetical protein